MDLLTVGFGTISFIMGITLMAYSSRIAESILRNFTSDYNPKKRNTDSLSIRLMALGAIFFAAGLGNLIDQFKNWK